MSEEVIKKFDTEAAAKKLKKQLLDHGMAFSIYEPDKLGNEFYLKVLSGADEMRAVCRLVMNHILLRVIIWIHVNINVILIKN